MENKIADALLRRKELAMKVEQIKTIQKDKTIFEFVFERKHINENIDDIKARAPKLSLSQVTEEYDFYANRLRLIDAAIQHANWTCSVNVDPKVWEDYTPKALPAPAQ